MKKTVILILGGAVALTLSLILSISLMSQSKAESSRGLFEANVEALAGAEHWGSCGDKEYLCQTKCPQCGEEVWVRGRQGPSSLTRCSAATH